MIKTFFVTHVFLKTAVTNFTSEYYTELREERQSKPTTYTLVGFNRFCTIILLLNITKKSIKKRLKIGSKMIWNLLLNMRQNRAQKDQCAYKNL